VPGGLELVPALHPGEPRADSGAEGRRPPTGKVPPPLPHG
jgi:hypothetical protein